jgi:hypothetical protein
MGIASLPEDQARWKYVQPSRFRIGVRIAWIGARYPADTGNARRPGFSERKKCPSQRQLWQYCKQWSLGLNRRFSRQCDG